MPAAPLDPTGRDVHAEASRLREHGAAVPAALPGGIDAWVVTDHGVLRTLLTDPRVSKDPRRHWPRWIRGDVPSDWPLISWVAVDNMFTAYGADHRRLRGLISQAFTPRRIESLRPRITALTDGLLDELDTTAPGDRVDLRDRFAHRLPIAVICELFGVSEPDRPALVRIVDAVFRTSGTPEETAATFAAMTAFLTDLVARKRAEPAEDMTSVLLAAVDDGGRALTGTELADTLILMLGAGHQTTADLLVHAIAALLGARDQLAAVRAGHHSWTDVVEETLRWQPPIANLPLRYAVSDIVLADGTVIPEGAPILAGYAGANRDPAHYGPGADRFDVGRGARDHLAFGHGVHFCLGAPLARMEAGIALPRLFERFGDMAPVLPPEDLDPLESFIANGYRTLPVVLRPA